MTQLGPIDKNSIYPLDVFRKMTGLKETAVRRAEKQGLQIDKLGNRKYVDGAEFQAYLKRSRENTTDE